MAQSPRYYTALDGEQASPSSQVQSVQPVRRPRSSPCVKTWSYVCLVVGIALVLSGGTWLVLDHTGVLNHNKFHDTRDAVKSWNTETRAEFQKEGKKFVASHEEDIIKFTANTKKTSRVWFLKKHLKALHFEASVPTDLERLGSGRVNRRLRSVIYQTGQPEGDFVSVEYLDLPYEIYFVDLVYPYAFEHAVPVADIIEFDDPPSFEAIIQCEEQGGLIVANQCAWLMRLSEVCLRVKPSENGSYTFEGPCYTDNRNEYLSDFTGLYSMETAFEVLLDSKSDERHVPLVLRHVDDPELFVYDHGVPQHHHRRHGCGGHFLGAVVFYSLVALCLGLMCYCVTVCCCGGRRRMKCRRIVRRTDSSCTAASGTTTNREEEALVVDGYPGAVLAAQQEQAAVVAHPASTQPPPPAATMYRLA